MIPKFKLNSLSCLQFPNRNKVGEECLNCLPNTKQSQCGNPLPTSPALRPSNTIRAHSPYAIVYPNYLKFPACAMFSGYALHLCVECSPCWSTLPYITKQTCHSKSYDLSNHPCQDLSTHFPESKLVYLPPPWIHCTLHTFRTSETEPSHLFVRLPR